MASSMPRFPLPRAARLAVFASGRGSNLEALLDAFPAGDPLARVVLVVSNRPRAEALERARRRGVPALAIPGRDRTAFEQRAAAAVDKAACDLILLAGFMRILSPWFVDRYAGRILNIHPSLLPAFPGLEPQRQALEAGASESGCTVHLVDHGVDSGPILLQRRVPVRPDDTVETLSRRILAVEHQAYPAAVRGFLRGELLPAAAPVLP